MLPGLRHTHFQPRSRRYRRGIDGEGKVIIRRQLKRRYVLAFFQ